MPTLKTAKQKTHDPQAVLARATEDIAEWLHCCYLLGYKGEPGKETKWVDLPEETRVKYRQVAGVMLTTPLDEWLAKNNRNPQVAERVQL